MDLVARGHKAAHVLPHLSKVGGGGIKLVVNGDFTPIYVVVMWFCVSIAVTLFLYCMLFLFHTSPSFYVTYHKE